jgi:hypothetical protein
MKTFKQFFIEDVVNYNHHNQAWQVRGDSEHYPFKGEHKHVIMKDVEPHVDYDAHESGKRLYAYLKGNHTKDVPTSATHKQRPIKFQKDNIDHPFVHTDDNSPVKKAHYVEFKGNSVIAHYKK